MEKSWKWSNSATEELNGFIEFIPKDFLMKIHQ